MSAKDLYGTLGVSRTATEQEIRKAYRALARKYHPDRNPGNKAAEERFKEASYASEVLLNSEKRRLYDEFGEMGLREGFNADAFRQHQQRGQAGGGFAGFSSLEDLLRAAGSQGGQGRWSTGGLQDLFGGADVVETIFGGRRGGNSGPRKRDIESEVTIEFVDAVRGAERELRVSISDQEPQTIRVRIPPGVRDGGRIRLRGQGVAGGDLVLLVHVNAHPHFKREGDDLLLDLPVTVAEAYRGAKIAVPTPEGEVNLRVPARVKSGAKLRLRSKGVRRGSEVGDLIVTIEVVLPTADGLDAHVDALEAAYGEPVRGPLSF